MFATAVIRGSSSSDNFVLQSATRCLRNIYSENINAKIYLSDETAKTLDKELQANFNTKLEDLTKKESNTTPVPIKVKRRNINPIKLTYKQKTVLQNSIIKDDIVFTIPDIKDENI
jgi:hypothetical protein